MKDESLSDKEVATIEKGEGLFFKTDVKKAVKKLKDAWKKYLYEDEYFGIKKIDSIFGEDLK